MNTIAVEMLRTWLEEGQPVTILDIRPEQDYAEWFIPGSIHVDAYDALKAHDPAVLSDVELPTDQPVVTVCGVGKTSLDPQMYLDLARSYGWRITSVGRPDLEANEEQARGRATALYHSLHKLLALPEGDLTALEAGANRCAIA